MARSSVGEMNKVAFEQAKKALQLVDVYLVSVVAGVAEDFDPRAQQPDYDAQHRAHLNRFMVLRCLVWVMTTGTTGSESKRSDVSIVCPASNRSAMVLGWSGCMKPQNRPSWLGHTGWP